MMLPANRKKLSIDEASSALDQMGYKLGFGQYEPKVKATIYSLKRPNGSETKVTTEQIKEIVYRGI